MRDQQVLNAALREQPMLWETEGFALANGIEDGQYVGLVAGVGDLNVSVTDSTLLVRPDVAAQQLATTGPAEEPDSSGGSAGGPTAVSEARPDIAHVPPGPPLRLAARYFGLKTLDPQRYAVDSRRSSTRCSRT